MTTITRDTFEADGRAIPYADQGEGPAIVLLPAQGLTTTYLATLASVAEEDGFRVIRVGTRRATGDAVTLHDLAQDVVDVMDHLGVADAWIGGHGFGGMLARTVAHDHLSRVVGVMLLGVRSTDPADPEAAAALDAIFAADADSDVSAAVSLLVGEGVDLDAATRIILHARDEDARRLQRAATEATPAAVWTELPAGIPNLLIQGELDRALPPTVGLRVQADAADRASVVTIPGAGFFFPLTHAGEVAAEIEDYLGWD